MEALNEAWNHVTTTCLTFEKTSMNGSKLKHSLSVLQHNAFIPIFHEWFFQMFRNDVRDNLVPRFWSSLQSDDNHFAENAYETLFVCYDAMHEDVTRWIHNEVIEMSFNSNTEELIQHQNNMKSLLRALLLSDAPTRFNVILLQTYSLAFQINQHRSVTLNDIHNEDMNHVNAICGGCHFGTNECRCESMLHAFNRFNGQLLHFGLLDVMVGDAVTSVMHSCIEKHIQHKCQGNFEVFCISNLKKWIEETVIGWLRTVYGESHFDMSHLEERLIHFLYETYANCRMEQMFDIIIEYPESEASLEDLKECIEKCANFRPKLIKTLKESLETRLLHPGVSTSDILAAYISAIKALRVLDPTGVILQLVCEPVRKYLKSRDDTVRCIITALTDDSSSELTPEFVKGNLQNNDEVNYNSDDENIAETWNQWQPDPIDAAHDAGTPKSLRCSDIVSILVNIYESKDLFVEEYQRLLAQRLLTNFECNIEHERRNLELLTLRFGESDLHACEVMLKDVTESKRISQRINAGEIEAHKLDQFPINSLILSAQFWPEKLGLPASEDISSLTLPPEVAHGTQVFTKAFETIKGSRTLNWMPHLGLVQLELEFNEKKLCFSVPPIQATIIWHFQQKQTWTINQLSEVMMIPPSILRRRIALWQNKGILKETTTDTFVLVDDERIVSSQTSNINDSVMNVEEDFDDDLSAEKAGTSANDERQDKFGVYWSFVVNMLHNLNSLPLERIQTMLQMFAMQGTNASELSSHELRHFLDSKVREQKLSFSQGHYKLPDSNH